ncbi:MAG: protein YgfX [Thiohalocapsa sp.]
MTIRPVASKRMLRFVLAWHAFALVTALSLPLHWSFRLLLAGSIVASLGYLVWARILNRAPWAIVAATWSDTGWRIETAGGRILDAELSPSTYIAVGLVILNFRSGPFCQQSVMLLPDNTDPDQLRRLRVRLRLIGTAATGSGVRPDAANL